LYAVIGTAFGTGDGSTTFNVPNLQGVSLTGVGAQSISGRAKTGPSLGAAREDQAQGHIHPITGGSGQQIYSTGGGAIAPATTPNYIGTAWGIGTPSTDGTNGTPRTGEYTHGPEVGVNFIIKY